MPHLPPKGSTLAHSGDEVYLLPLLHPIGVLQRGQHQVRHLREAREVLSMRQLLSAPCEV